MCACDGRARVPAAAAAAVVLLHPQPVMQAFPYTDHASQYEHPLVHAHHMHGRARALAHARRSCGPMTCAGSPLRRRLRRARARRRRAAPSRWEPGVVLRFCVSTLVLRAATSRWAPGTVLRTQARIHEGVCNNNRSSIIKCGRAPGAAACPSQALHSWPLCLHTLTRARMSRSDACTRTQVKEREIERLHRLLDAARATEHELVASHVQVRLCAHVCA